MGKYAEAAERLAELGLEEEKKQQAKDRAREAELDRNVPIFEEWLASDEVQDAVVFLKAVHAGISFGCEQLVVSDDGNSLIPTCYVETSIGEGERRKTDVRTFLDRVGGDAQSIILRARQNLDYLVQQKLRAYN